MKLTTALVKKGLRTPGKYADGNGLFLQVQDADRRYWMFRYRVGGKEQVMALGNAADLSLAEAREKRARVRGKLVDGVDPLAARDATREAAKAAAKTQPTHTFSEAANLYIASHKAGWRARGEYHWRHSLFT